MSSSSLSALRYLISIGLTFNRERGIENNAIIYKRKRYFAQRDAFITPGIPVVTSTHAPNTKETFWNPTSPTLDFEMEYAVELNTYEMNEYANPM